ncbi:hypothetical protein [Deinococcus sp. Leaf326]|uniref:hypothetical protein n=1 Tax=Deinococcus sp. Leaf326 TaxID=1736338 RepID=UPI0006FAB21B|nr:hypothetical protein [Deinococcus sp. Leaf326]KQR41004.1 hypothetical protein ASF71_02390 [Deinococcus sp. Leaf326]
MPRLAWLFPLCALPLVACAPVTGPATLRFAPEAAAPVAPDPTRLLTTQTVPQDLLLSVPEAVRRAPDGSVIVVCGARAQPWGVCTHVARKLAPGLISDSPGLFAGGVQNRPETTLYGRAAVIVLDVGVTPDRLASLRAEASRLRGAPYLLAGETAAGLDCTTYQNLLQRAAGLPDVTARNPAWRLWLPQDILTGPAVQAGGRVLWVGMAGVP